jgi:hypothetical protein
VTAALVIAIISLVLWVIGVIFNIANAGRGSRY